MMDMPALVASIDQGDLHGGLVEKEDDADPQDGEVAYIMTNAHSRSPDRSAVTWWPGRRGRRPG